MIREKGFGLRNEYSLMKQELQMTLRHMKRAQSH